MKNYQEYEALFNSELVVAVRNVLMMIEDGRSHDIMDSPEHNALKNYFNKFRLHNKMTMEQYAKSFKQQ